MIKENNGQKNIYFLKVLYIHFVFRILKTYKSEKKHFSAILASFRKARYS